jgi:UDP-2,3-diacylglucosamine hydrolase
MKRKRVKIYFASDFHLGTPNFEESLIRERKIVSWLEEVRKDATQIFLMGDLFDFWFEYKYTAPKGFTRFLGTIANIVDSGIPVHFFIGNHDMWMFDYLELELGVTIHRKQGVFKLGKKTFFLGHGDGLGPGDGKYKIIKKIFASKISQWFFARVHPNFSFTIANNWSRASRKKEKEPQVFLGEEKEWLISYCKRKLKENNTIDYFLFGHRHLPISHEITENCKYINTGDWLNHFTYAVFDGEQLELKKFEHLK